MSFSAVLLTPRRPMTLSAFIFQFFLLFVTRNCAVMHSEANGFFPVEAVGIDEGITQIIEGASSINLRDAGISDREIEFLCEIVEANPTLKRLSLEGTYQL
eukprot:TRINITY_DN4527_c0_g2_i1.p1 TRINITY_DN4527_c0_g2~~TRINITY_DN4527_c0_g2_i1.p1  ORF type:complete len:101 (-),score=21.20 TRINITY_DN4527_c0_g2_i1:29-331(-)